MFKLIIFFFVGTLLNTIDDLADCTNYVLQKNGYPTHEIDAYKYFVGNGVEQLLRRALPKNVAETAFSDILNEFMHYYEIHKGDKTAPYEGLVETLESLQEQGIQFAIATNKPHELLPALIRYYFPTIKWAAIFGYRKDTPIKPHPQIVYDILEVTQIDKADTLYIGDTAVDMMTAQNAGIQKVGVLWGFRTQEELEQAHADFIISQPQQLASLFFDKT
jgi:phosphoglycolate phosphatase